MSSLPKIVGHTEEVVVPAVEEKVYPDGFIVKLYLPSPDANGVQFFQVVTRPYNYDTKELYPDNSRDVSHQITNIWHEAARSTTFAQLMGSICQVTSWLISERQLAAIEKRTAEEEAELAQVQHALGVAQ